ncbi:cell division protein ZapA [Virgibacillus sp. W0430]|uniref:cell division protein ZapA n=1 Tax=Virgibacillus sp. W0430 TaxID=3391580 RepID=UPI003F471A75
MTDQEKTRITVEIHKKMYTIVGTESPNHVQQIARLVDEKMHEIQKSNVYLDTTRLAVLTAVNTMNDYIKLKEEYETLLSLIEEERG